jgi:hypothetical protein
VIAYFLPFDPAIPRSNHRGTFSSEAWAVAYIETNRLIAGINERINGLLEHAGFRGTRLPATHNFDEEQLMSDWSHKHVAYIAGIGSFGHHHMLITDKGCCGRLGSVVTDAAIVPTPRTGALPIQIRRVLPPMRKTLPRRGTRGGLLSPPRLLRSALGKCPPARTLRTGRCLRQVRCHRALLFHRSGQTRLPEKPVASLNLSGKLPIQPHAAANRIDHPWRRCFCFMDVCLTINPAFGIAD